MPSHASVPNRALSPGEPLFSPSQRLDRNAFQCRDGTVLRRELISLTRISKDGHVVRRYGAPWYLAWATMPLPAGLGIISTAILGLIDMIRRKSRGSASKRGPTIERVG